MNSLITYIKKTMAYAGIGFLLIFGKLSVKLFPLKRMQWLIGKPLDAKPELNNSARKFARAKKIGGWTVKTSKKVFWRSVCLDQALAAAVLLRIWNIDFLFHLGVSLKDQFKAHAWISVNDDIILGRHSGYYKEISTFGKKNN